MAVRLLALLGLLLSLYALTVKWRAETKGYKPLCDLGKHVSCTKAFTSTAGALFGISNPVLGIVFYTFLLLRPGGLFAEALVVAAVLLSLFLAYISYVRQRNFCVVCTSIYVINFLLLFAVR